MHIHVRYTTKTIDYEFCFIENIPIGQLDTLVKMPLGKFHNMLKTLFYTNV